MTGGIRFRYTAVNMAEAVDIALAKWRQWVDDPAAELPWSTHYEAVEEKSGIVVDCRIEFERTLMERTAVSSVGSE